MLTYKTGCTKYKQNEKIKLQPKDFMQQKNNSKSLMLKLISNVFWDRLYIVIKVAKYLAYK